MNEPHEILAGVPLHDILTELELLGSLLHNNRHFDAVTGLQPGHFLEPLHQVIFAAIETSISRGEPASALTVREALPPDINIDGLDRYQYLARLAAIRAIPAHVRDHADRIIHYAAAREHVLTARDLLDANRGGVPIAEALRIFHDQSEAIRNGYRGPGLRDMARSSADVMNAMMERLTAAVNGERRVSGIPTGLVDLDARIGGLRRGHLVVVAGRPGMGKSSFMVSVARQIAERREFGVGINSMEMNEEELGDRIATESAYDPRYRIAYSSVRDGRISLSHQQSVTDAGRHLAELPIEYDFAKGITIAEISSSARRMAAKLAKKRVTLDVLMIDYSELIKASDRYRGQKHYEIGEITVGLKVLAGQLNCCIVLFHQVNRGVESRDGQRPRLSDLRLSGNVEQDADEVILLYREAYYLVNPEDQAQRNQVEFDLELNVAKNRHGPTGIDRIFADMGSCALRSPAPPAFEHRQEAA